MRGHLFFDTFFGTGRVCFLDGSCRNTAAYSTGSGIMEEGWEAGQLLSATGPVDNGLYNGLSTTGYKPASCNSRVLIVLDPAAAPPPTGPPTRPVRPATTPP